MPRVEMPDEHPEDGISAVMPGVFHVDLSEEFQGDRVEVYPLGSIIVLRPPPPRRSRQ
jgi:hypothetical protein